MKKLLMGNEAIAHAALEAGVAVVAGYPGTPSSEIVETVARQRKRGAAHGVHVEWSTNEKVALELLFGASLAGKRGLFTCKQMGLNVASDALMCLNYVSVRAGLVLVVADDPGPISSQTEQDTRRFAAFAKVPVLDPASPEQAYDMVKAAFDLSERFRTPVIVRPTTRVDHASTFIDVADETTARTPLAGMSSRVPDAGGQNEPDPGATQALPSGFVRDPDKWVIFPKRAYEAHGEINERLAEMARVFSTNPAYAQFNQVTEVEATPLPARAHARQPQQAEPGVNFGIIAGGITAAYAREALGLIEKEAAEAGVRVPGYRFMQVGTPFPFPETAVAAFAQGLSDILVLEELDYVLEDELMRFAGRAHAAFNVHGKLTGEARDRGENDVDDVTARLERFLGLTGRLSLFRLRGETRNATFGEEGPSASSVSLDGEAAASLPARPPVLCAGCPHRGSFYAVKLALGDTPAVMCGDIGCYTLGNARPLEAVDTCLCMGGGITMAQGIAVADPDKKAVAFVGDSTLFASGMTGLANAAYNNHDITVMVLDNATTAMTGSQPHPGTGVTLMDGYSEPLDIASVLSACGFVHVYHANPLDRDASVAAARAAIAHEGPAAVIFKSPCAQLVPADPPALVNRDACTGCKRCITSIGCPAISFNSNVNGPRSRGRGQAVIDTDLCVGCNLCVQVCPFRAIVPGEAVAEMENTPAWPPYAPTTLAASQLGLGVSDATEEPEQLEVSGGIAGLDPIEGSGPIASADADTRRNAQSAFPSPAESGPFRPYPAFENPWEHEDATTGRNEQGENPESAEPDETPQPEVPEMPDEDLEPLDRPKESADLESIEDKAKVESRTREDAEADAEAGATGASSSSDLIPDFGIAADFEDEIEAELGADADGSPGAYGSFGAEAGAQSQLPLEGGLDD